MLRRRIQRPGDQQESSCDSCEWTPLYERRAFRNAEVQRCGDCRPCSEPDPCCSEKAPSESRIFLKSARVGRTRSPCCARPANGPATAAPPRSVMNARRFKPKPPVLPTERIAYLSEGRRLLRCGISIRSMSGSGSKPVKLRMRKCFPERPKAAVQRTTMDGREVPEPDSCAAAQISKLSTIASAGGSKRSPESSSI